MLELVLYYYKYKDLLIITSKSDNIIMKKSSTKTPLEHVPNLQRQIGIRRIEVFPLGHLFSQVHLNLILEPKIFWKFRT